MRHWKSEEALVDGFKRFAQKVPFFGFVVLCMDHPVVQSIIPSIKRKVISYGFTPQADVRAVNIQFNGIHSSFDLLYHGNNLGRIQLDMPGKHNISNALASAAVCLELEVPIKDIQEALNGFTGVERRFTIRSEFEYKEQPFTIIDDYGHHPVEIAATLSAAQQAWPSRRIVAVCQPHRYSRVEELFSDFCRCFNHAGKLVITPIYRAGEKPIEGINHRVLTQKISEHGHRNVHAVDSLAEATEYLKEHLLPGDVVITLGAGNINQICSPLKDHFDGNGA